MKLFPLLLAISSGIQYIAANDGCERAIGKPRGTMGMTRYLMFSQGWGELTVVETTHHFHQNVEFSAMVMSESQLNED